MRWFYWLVIYCFLLGAATIDVVYSDGLEIHLKGWLKKEGERG